MVYMPIIMHKGWIATGFVLGSIVVVTVAIRVNLAPTGPIYTPAQVQAALLRNSHAWDGRSLLVHGVEMAPSGILFCSAGNSKNCHYRDLILLGPSKLLLPVVGTPSALDQGDGVPSHGSFPDSWYHWPLIGPLLTRLAPKTSMALYRVHYARPPQYCNMYWHCVLGTVVR